MNIFVNLTDGEGIMIFTEEPKMTVEIAQKFCEACGYEVAETYEVKDWEVQYYCYDPFWMTEDKFEKVVKLLNLNV